MDERMKTMTTKTANSCLLPTSEATAGTEMTMSGCSEPTDGMRSPCFVSPWRAGRSLVPVAKWFVYSISIQHSPILCPSLSMVTLFILGTSHATSTLEHVHNVQNSSTDIVLVPVWP